MVLFVIGATAVTSWRSLDSRRINVRDVEEDWGQSGNSLTFVGCMSYGGS